LAQYGPELVVPNCSFDGPAHLIYAFLGENDDGGVTYEPVDPITAGEYAYSFECLTTDGQYPMHVRICGEVDSDSEGRLKGATEPGLFSGTITVSEQAVAEQAQTILLSVTGVPTVATARYLKVQRILS
jgi:hypothetical protein